MLVVHPAKLAVVLLLMILGSSITQAAEDARPCDPGAIIELDSPRSIKFVLRDGVAVRGELASWSSIGIDGSFGERAWREINAADVWRILRLVFNESGLRGDAQAWVCAGRILLDVPGGEKDAEGAFRRALRMDAAMTEAIAAARAEVKRLQLERQLEQEAADAEKLRTQSPESKDWGDAPWPQLDADAQRAAVRVLRADAKKILEGVSLSIQPVETDYFLFYSDMPRRETAKWALELDRMYKVLARTFELEPGANIFWGKAVIFVFNERQTFVDVERDVFRQLLSNDTQGICHPIGPKVFVNFYRQPDDMDFATILVHEAVHGFVHRFQTPRRLPTWANEGFADYLATNSFRGSRRGADLRSVARAFVRDGGNVNHILDMDYEHPGSAAPAWPGPNAVGYAVGYLLVDLMIRDRPRAFGKWVEAVKAGKDWEEALVEDFGVSRAKLVEVFRRYYLVND